MAVNVARPPQGAPPAARQGWWSRLVEYWHGIVAEMKRVTWPDRVQVRQSTIFIIIFVLLVGLVITFLDTIFSLVLVKWIPGLFGG